MAVASVPGKIILLGEHGVIYGQPCLSAAIDLRVGVEMRPGDVHEVNGRPLDGYRHTYIKHAIETLWEGPPLQTTTFSNIPSASGLGSSAAITTASVACILSLSDAFSPESVARRSFEVEYEVQGGGSPNDTSACTHGGAILLARKKRHGFLWKISRDGRTWYVHKIDIPAMTDVHIVVGMTGIKSKTPRQVKKVRRFVTHSGFGRELTERIGELVIEGIDALQHRDYVALGQAMNEAQKNLHTLGASSDALEKLIAAARRAGAYGAKLTGAGGGGSIIALTDEPERVAIAIEKAGGRALVTSVSSDGVKMWD